MLIFWFLLLLPWLPLATLGSGMVFEAGYTFAAYYFLFTVWSYPILLV